MQNFQCYQIALSAVRLVRPLIGRIEVHDRDLGRQLRRCLSSVPLNIAEVAPGKAWEEEVMM